MKSTGSAARAAVFGLWALLSTSGAHAQQQFLLLDTTYTATAQNTSDSHFAAEPHAGSPSDWKSPTDYTQGKAYVELDILQKPSAVSTLYNICFENDSGAACLPYGPAYTATGHSAWSSDFPSFWNFNVVDWTKGVTKISLILKDAQENKKQGDPDFYPYQAHVVISIVPKGMSYVAPAGQAGTAAAGSGGSGSGGRSGMSGGGGRRAAAGRGGAPASGGAGATAVGGGGRASTSGGAPDAGTQDASVGSPAAPSAVAGTNGPAADGGSGDRAAPNAAPGTASNVLGEAGRSSAASQLEDSGGCTLVRVRAESTLGWAAFGLALACLGRARGRWRRR